MPICKENDISVLVFASSARHIHAGLDKKIFHHKIVNDFLPISFNICFGCSKEPSP